MRGEKPPISDREGFARLAGILRDAVEKAQVEREIREAHEAEIAALPTHDLTAAVRRRIDET